MIETSCLNIIFGQIIFKLLTNYEIARRYANGEKCHSKKRCKRYIGLKICKKRETSLHENI